MPRARIWFLFLAGSGVFFSHFNSFSRASDRTNIWNGLRPWYAHWDEPMKVLHHQFVGSSNITGGFFTREYFQVQRQSSLEAPLSLESLFSSPCCSTGREMRTPRHRALGQHDNWGRLFVSRWLCESLRRVFGAGARSVHHSATSQLHLELSAVPIIAWHRHPYLFSWKFIIYDTSSFLPPGTWMLLSC